MSRARSTVGDAVEMGWDPVEYQATIRDEVHDYDRLQEEVVDATRGRVVRAVLDLGVGAGETASRALAIHPGASLTGIDSSPEMLTTARDVLPQQACTLIEQDLLAPLPPGPYDLVISALAIHHLQGLEKAELFRRVRSALALDGLFVFGDVVVPDISRDAVIEHTDRDFPSTTGEQLDWLAAAGFRPQVVWARQDLVVIRAEPVT